MASELIEIRTKLCRHHVLAAVWKACLFGAIGYSITSHEVTTGRLIFGCVLTLFIAAFTEYFWLYRPSIKKHTELLEKFGDGYVQKLIEAIDELGYSRIVNSFWISRCYDEMMR